MTTPAKTTTKAPAAKTSRTSRTAKTKSAAAAAKRPDSPELAALREDLQEFKLQPGEEPWDWATSIFTGTGWDQALAAVDTDYRTARVEIHGDFERAHALVCKGMQPCWERPEWHGLGEAGTRTEGPRHRRPGVSVRLLERVREGIAAVAPPDGPQDEPRPLPPGVEPLPQRIPGTSGIVLPPGKPFAEGSNVVVHRAAVAEVVPPDEAEGQWLRNIRAALKDEAEREDAQAPQTSAAPPPDADVPAAEKAPGPAPAFPPAGTDAPPAGPGAQPQTSTEDGEQPGRADPLKVGKWETPGDVKDGK